MIDSTELDSFNRPKPSDEFESYLFETDDVVAFDFSYGNGYPGSTFGYSSTEGNLFLSNLRLIFVTKPESSTFKCFAVSMDDIIELKLQSGSVFRFSKNVLQAKISMVNYRKSRLSI